jgi:nicotinamidase-related amidase
MTSALVLGAADDNGAHVDSEKEEGKLSNPFENEDILLVIDMQTRFVGSRYLDIQDNVRNAVQLARQAHIPVICFEFMRSEWGSTVTALTEELQGYSEFKVLRKDSMSCYDSLMTYLKSRGLHLNRTMWVCGLFSNGCIWDSVSDLCRDDFVKKVVVLADSCGDSQEKNEAFFKKVKMLSENSHPESIFRKLLLVASIFATSM